MIGSIKYQGETALLNELSKPKMAAKIEESASGHTSNPKVYKSAIYFVPVSGSSKTCVKQYVRLIRQTPNRMNEMKKFPIYSCTMTCGKKISAIEITTAGPMNSKISPMKSPPKYSNEFRPLICIIYRKPCFFSVMGMKANMPAVSSSPKIRNSAK